MISLKLSTLELYVKNYLFFLYYVLSNNNGLCNNLNFICIRYFFKATLYFEFVIFLVQHVYYQFDVMHTLKSYGNVQITVKIIKLQLIKCINKA